VIRLVFALVLLAGGLALSQPSTYRVPITARTPGTAPVGNVGMGAAIWLPDPGTDPSQSLLFGFGGGSAVPFVLNTQALGTVSGFPTQVDAIAAAPGVLVEGNSKTLLAILSNGAVRFATVENNGTLYNDLGPTTPIDAGTVVALPPIALSAVPGGGAALLVSDGSQITRFEIDTSTSPVSVSQGGTISAGATDTANALVFNGFTNQGFVGGRVVGDLYQFDARLDAGPPSIFDFAQTSLGRVKGPVTGLALYSVPSATYLLVPNGFGLTIYDVSGGASTGFIVIPVDGGTGPLAQISVPAGVAVTNLAVDSVFPGGVIAVGDPTRTDLALLRWDQLALEVDGGLVVDPNFDPRTAFLDGGTPDGGVPDGGAPDGGSGGGGGTVPGGGPLGPGIPVDHGSSSCSTAAGGPVLLLLLAGLALLPRRRQRR
jgi:MYXO-CTERM domain-containing protein